MTLELRAKGLIVSGTGRAGARELGVVHNCVVGSELARAGDLSSRRRPVGGSRRTHPRGE
eukprot:480323-Pleurochrysis_carterae.AAC.1